jgi:hypothetical protein
MTARRRLGLLLALAASLAALVVGDQRAAGEAGGGAQAQAVVMPARAVPPRPAGEAAGSLADQFLKARQGRLAESAPETGPVDLFAARTWYVPPPPPAPAKPVPPPPPSAPPLPFAFMGQYLEPSGRQVIFLVRGDRLYTTSPGEVIDNTYRVEGIQSGQLGLTYLPLNIKQTLSVGEAS